MALQASHAIEEITGGHFGPYFARGEISRVTDEVVRIVQRLSPHFFDLSVLITPTERVLASVIANLQWFGCGGVTTYDPLGGEDNRFFWN